MEVPEHTPELYGESIIRTSNRSIIGKFYYHIINQALGRSKLFEEFNLSKTKKLCLYWNSEKGSRVVRGIDYKDIFLYIKIFGILPLFVKLMEKKLLQSKKNMTRREMLAQNCELGLFI